MTQFMQLVATLSEQARATMSRSDVLKPLAWLVGILMTATVGLVLAQAPSWLLLTMAGVLILSILLYVFAYVYCLFKNPDALRSESYSLNKLAIEHRLIGDSSTGLFQENETGGGQVLSESPKRLEGPA